jgi:hypothetical protein
MLIMGYLLMSEQTSGGFNCFKRLIVVIIQFLIVNFKENLKMNFKNLIKSWSHPDRTAERTQLTLRLSFDDYARLQALKEIYKNRSINDMISDILKGGLDEIVDALPSYFVSREEAENAAYHTGEPVERFLDSKTGPKIFFETAYHRILQEKSESESNIEQKEVA